MKYKRWALALLVIVSALLVTVFIVFKYSARVDIKSVQNINSEIGNFNTNPDVSTTSIEPSKLEGNVLLNLDSSNIRNLTSGNKEYFNNNFSFEFPDAWIPNNDFGGINITSPENNLTRQSGQYKNDYYLNNFSVRKCESLNTGCALGGWWEGMRTYKDIPDLLTDESSFVQLNQSEKTWNLNGQLGYWITIGGMDNAAGLIVERRSQIYFIMFPNIYTPEEMSLEQKRILSSFKFID